MRENIDGSEIIFLCWVLVRSGYKDDYGIRKIDNVPCFYFVESFEEHWWPIDTMCVLPQWGDLLDHLLHLDSSHQSALSNLLQRLKTQRHMHDDSGGPPEGTLVLLGCSFWQQPGRTWHYRMR